MKLLVSKYETECFYFINIVSTYENKRLRFTLSVYEKCY